MSLINDYLKKTQNESPPLEQPGDVPPVLKSSGKGKGGSPLVRLVIIVFIGVIAGALYFKFQFSPQKTTPPPESIAQEISSRQAPVEKKEPTIISFEKTISENSPQAKEKPETPVKYGEVPPQPEKISVAEATPPVETKVSSQKSAPSAPATPSLQAQAPPPVQIKPIEKAEKVEVDISHLYQTGLLAEKDGDFKGAEKFYQVVLKKDPSHIEALTNLSGVYIQLNRFTEAESTLKKVLRINPKNTKALVNLGIIDLKLNQFASAEGRFKEVLQLNPKDETALINLAYLAQRENNVLLMEKYYKDILSVDPDNYQVLLVYASFLEKNNRFAEAQTYYQNCLNLDEVKGNEQLNNQIKDRIKLLKDYIQEK